MIELLQNIISILIMLLITTLLSLIMFVINTDKVKKNAFMVIGAFGLGGAVFSGVISLLYKKEILHFEHSFILLQLLALIFGIVFLNLLYNQLWARRNTQFWSEDSILSEFSYTLAASQFYALLSIVLFYSINKERVQEAISLWSLFVPFILPFVCLKTFDLFNQVPSRDFKYKWRYTLHPLNENNWRNELGLTFNVAESLEHETKFLARRARIFVRAPRRDWNIGDIFRIALKHYHENNPTIEIYDVGDDISEDFWWLFKYQFSLFTPKSWFPGTRYIDPNSTIEDNGITLNSVIRVKRVMNK